MDLRIFTEPQQGATYDDLLAVARATEQLGFDGFFRSDHYLHMAGDGTARADRRLDHPRRAGPRHQPHPARHPGQLGHVPAARAARDDRRRRRPDERRPGRARPGRRLVRAGARRLRHPLPPARRALRPARGAARRHHRPVVDPRRVGPSSTTGRTTRCALTPGCPSRCSPAACRSSSAVAASAAPPPSPPATPPTSTPASGRWRTPAASSSRWMPCATEIGRDPATLVHSAAQVAVPRARRRRRCDAARRRSAATSTSSSRTASPARSSEVARPARPAGGGRRHPPLPAGARPRRPRPPRRRARRPRRRTGSDVGSADEHPRQGP